MPRGVFRDKDGFATVDYGTHRLPIPREYYVANDYEPPYDTLPTEQEYNNSGKQ